MAKKTGYSYTSKSGRFKRSSLKDNSVPKAPTRRQAHAQTMAKIKADRDIALGANKGKTTRSLARSSAVASVANAQLETRQIQAGESKAQGLLKDLNDLVNPTAGDSENQETGSGSQGGQQEESSLSMPY